MSQPWLSPRETQILAHIANGGTYASAAEQMPITANTAEWYGKQVVRKLGARNMANAVLLACRAGLLDGKPRRHGDHAGYEAHRKRGEPPCDDCRTGEAAYRVGLNRRRRAEKRAQEGLSRPEPPPGSPSCSDAPGGRQRAVQPIRIDERPAA